LYRQAPLGQQTSTLVDSDATDLSTPDPTAAIFSQLPPASIDWPLVALSSLALAGAIGMFWLAIHGAGQAARIARR
jgi:hypothetical protein